MEDEDEQEASAEVQPESTPPPARLYVDGVPVSRLQVDFAKDTGVFIPGLPHGGFVLERQWDLQNVDSPGLFSRPRLLGDANIFVHAEADTLKIVLTWPGRRTVLYAANACISYT